MAGHNLNWDRELEKELQKIRKVFWKTFLNSKEFKNFKKKLRDFDIDLDLSLAVFLVGKQRVKIARKNGRMGKAGKVQLFKLSRKDKEFLKTYGIKWD